MQTDDAGEPAAAAEALACVRNVAALVEPVSALTAASLHALAGALAGDRAQAASVNAFSAHFGRGQQYVSFVREL
jgi:hypothetical protein